MFEPSLLEELTTPVKLLAGYIKRNLGVRIGQSTVLSQKVHTVDPRRPEAVTILQYADAGKVFYRRQQPGQVFHFDIFHECGEIDHRKVAAAIVKSIDSYNFANSMHQGFYYQNRDDVKPDYFDVQTATGGGRITGSLEFGKKLSLRKGHQNHVHIAGMLAQHHLPCVFFIVKAVEAVIIDSGLELRANEFITHDSAAGKGNSMDLSPYSDQSDSFLQEKGVEQDSALKRQQFMQDAAELSEEMDGVKDVYDTLSAIERGDTQALKSLAPTPAQRERIVQSLSDMGIISMQPGEIALTQYGRELKDFLTRRLPDVESYIRRMYRLFKPYDTCCGRTKTDKTGENGCGRRTVSDSKTGELSMPHTIQAAAGRWAANLQGALRIEQSDIRYCVRRTKSKTEVCVLLDASASMAGQRMNAAKYLVRHLLLSTPDKVSVVLFQENRATVQVPFTRDYDVVQQSLKQITAIGSTPLGLGITACLKYLGEFRPKNPLIVLVTDGVPTYADVTQDPLQDALNAAKAIKAKGYQFTCIGLRAHKDYLNKLAKTAGGNIFMLEELEKHALVRSARQV